MKAIWEDMFCDIENGNSSKEEATGSVALEICRMLIDAENAINCLEPKQAIKLLREVRETI
jgi:hypothetical protein